MYIIKIHNWQPNIALTHGITACCSVIVTKLITSTTVVTQYWSPSQLVVVSNFAEYRWKSEQLCDYWLGKLSASTKSAWIFMYWWTRSKKVIICESLLWLFLYYYFIVVFTSWLYICDVTTTTTTFSDFLIFIRSTLLFKQWRPKHTWITCKKAAAAATTAGVANRWCLWTETNSQLILSCYFFIEAAAGHIWLIYIK